MRLRLAHRTVDLDGPPVAMAIVNVTPDSFYDGGVSASPEDAVSRALEMLAAGAAIVDVGGMTAQPGAELAEAEEAARVMPTVAGIRAAAPAAVLSVDTYRAGVAAAALDAGADLVNDHTGGADPALAAVVAERDAGLVVTHLGLQPKQVQDDRYEITPEAIAESLVGRAATAEAAGVRRDAILLDPGLGFGKSTATDLACLRALDRLTALGYPLLLACSHKEVTAEPLGLPESNLEGTAAVVAVAAAAGVRVLRVHDLPFMERVARMAWLASPRAEGYAAGGVRSGENSGTNLPPE
jgi:dihydropteroate synthase